MENLALSQFLSLYTWFAVAALLLFTLLIARFYQKFSGISTNFGLFGVVVLLLGISTVRNTSLRRMTGDPIADSLAFVGGLILLVLCVRLYRRMMRHE